MCWRSLTLAIPFAICLFVSPSSAKKKPPAAPINLNTATSEQLQQVPGIGPSTADKILQMRKSYGAFKSVDDLLAVQGIGPKRLEKMRKYLVVAKAPTSKPAVAAKNAAAVPATAKKPPPVDKPAPPDEEPEEP
jgi:competence ComEA-like helix-hairpin-helix protein